MTAYNPFPRPYFLPGDPVVLRVAVEPVVTFEVVEIVEKWPGRFLLMLGTVAARGLPLLVGFFDPDDVKLVEAKSAMPPL